MTALMNKISIPSILEVGMDKFRYIAPNLEKAGIASVVVFWGEGIKQMFGGQILDSLKGNDFINLLKVKAYDDILKRILKTD